MTHEEWLEYGWKNGYVSAPMCIVHDGWATTPEEDEELEEGHDPCLFMMRVYEDDDQRAAVEANHPAASWRASNRGWTRDG